MSSPSDRRGFLRGLATLPLIGGGVTLIGRPVAAAVPISKVLLETYDAWLDRERSFLKWERFGPEGFDRAPESPFEVVFHNRCTGETFDSIRLDNGANGYHNLRGPQPSTRAAIVLSAVGCGWRRERK